MHNVEGTKEFQKTIHKSKILFRLIIKSKKKNAKKLDNQKKLPFKTSLFSQLFYFYHTVFSIFFLN